LGTENEHRVGISRRFRVAMVAASPFPFPQGSQVLIAQLSRALYRRGHVVHIVAYHAGAGGPSGGVGVHRIPSLPIGSRVSAKPSFYKPFLDLLLARELLRLLRREAIEIIHTHNFEGLLVGLLARWRTGVPVVYHVHNLMTPELPTYFDGRLGKWAGLVVGRWVDRHLPRHADCCIALSASAASALREAGVPAECIRQVPPGIAFDAGEQPAHDDAAALRADYALTDGPIVLYAGNLDRYQDIELLLQSFRRVAAARPDVRLVLASHAESNPYRALVTGMELAQSVRFITLADFAALCGLLHISDVAVSPRTVCFGFPIKLLNYMAAGKPIVASEGSAQGIGHLENGWVVPNGDAEAFAQAILTLLKDRALADRLGRGAYQTATQVYTWERTVVEIEKAYETLYENYEKN
jgi:1,2-diacylglycerol 3-alpha-glucosyltransferase